MQRVSGLARRRHVCCEILPDRMFRHNNISLAGVRVK